MTFDRFRPREQSRLPRFFRPLRTHRADSVSTGPDPLPAWQRPEPRAANTRRVNGLFALLAMLGVATIARAGMLQVGQAADYRNLAEDNRSRTVAVPAERGGIVDRLNRPIVENIPDFSATLIPEKLPDDPNLRQQTILQVAEAAGLQPGDIEQELAEFKTFPSASVTIAVDLTQEQAVRLGILQESIPGLSVESTMRRAYPFGATTPSLSHVLGYVGRVTAKDLENNTNHNYAPADVLGKAGIEKSYEAALRGSFGSRRVEVDAAGRAKHIIAERPPVPGSTLVLAIDTDLQTAAEVALAKELKSLNTKRGSVIILDPNNGEVLAMVSLPAYDNNLFASGISRADYDKLSTDANQPLFPRAVAASLPSGSTFKPVVAAAALDEGFITESTSFHSTGGLQVSQWYFPDWKSGGHGWTDVKKAIAESVNTFFYIIGGGFEDRPGLGPELIASYAQKFGFGNQLGIDLPGEGSGFLPSPEWKERVKHEEWYVGDTYHFSIGQGDLLVTPLQVAAMTSAIANGGTLWKPQVVKAIREPDGKLVERKPEIISQPTASPSAIDIIRRGMRQTVVSGSTRSILGTLPVAAAAKSGTAQWRTGKTPHAWITAFAPFTDPEITVTVALEEGGQGSEGGQRVAGEILNWYFSPTRHD